jgi:hypothetical protein
MDQWIKDQESMDPGTTMEILTDFEFNVALHLSILSYTNRIPGSSYKDFIKLVSGEYKKFLNRLGLEYCNHKPVLDIANNNIRSITANIGTVVFICITGSSSISDHASNFAVAATRIGRNPKLSIDVPAGYLYLVQNLGIVNLVQELIESKKVSKVVLCGHSRGGSAAHVAHYCFLTEPDINNDRVKKITSVAFGSTPFLRCHSPNVEFKHYFLTYFTDMDIVPAIFAASKPLLDQVFNIYGREFSMLNLVTGINVADSSDDIKWHLQKVLSEYIYYGDWVRLHQGQEEKKPVNKYTIEDAKAFFTGKTFAKLINSIKTLDNVKVAHSISSAYKVYLKVAPAPYIISRESIHISGYVAMMSAKHLTSVGFSKDMLAVRLNRAVAAAAVARSFGHSEIYYALVKFKSDLQEYVDVGNNLIVGEENVDFKSRVCKIMRSLEDMLVRLSLLQPEQNDSVNVDGLRTFNESKGENLTTTILRVTHLLAVDYVPLKQFHWNKFTEFCGKHFSKPYDTFAALTKMVGSFVSEMIKAAKEGEFHVSYVNASEALQVLNKLKVESFRDVSSEYDCQLMKMAINGKIVEASLSKLSTVAIEAIFGKQVLCNEETDLGKILRAYQNVILSISALDEKVNKLVFIVLNGPQTVGKSWFIQSVIGGTHNVRQSTNNPIYYQYKITNEKVDVYFVDMPGNNSNDERLVQYAVDLFGIGSIGIGLIPFDIRPPRIDMSIFNNAFSGCDEVLICLNKVINVAIDLDNPIIPGEEKVLEKVINTWRGELPELRFGHAYHVMATELRGYGQLLASDEEERTAQLFIAKKAIRKVVANGGQSTEHVKEWIEKAVSTIVSNRKL